MDLARYMPIFGIDDASLVSEIMNDSRLETLQCILYDPFVEYNEFDALNPDDIYTPETNPNRRNCDYVDLEEFGQLGSSNSHVHLFLNIRSIQKNLEEFLCNFNIESNKIYHLKKRDFPMI